MSHIIGRSITAAHQRNFARIATTPKICTYHNHSLCLNHFWTTSDNKHRTFSSPSSRNITSKNSSVSIEDGCKLHPHTRQWSVGSRRACARFIPDNAIRYCSVIHHTYHNINFRTIEPQTITNIVLVTKSFPRNFTSKNFSTPATDSSFTASPLFLTSVEEGCKLMLTPMSMAVAYRCSARSFSFYSRQHGTFLFNFDI